MYPYLPELGGFRVPAYGAAIVLAALIGGVQAWRTRPKDLFSLEQYLSICLLTVIGASFGARLAAVIVQGDFAAASVISALRFDERRDLASIGVPFIVFPLLWGYCRHHRIRLASMLDHLFPYALFGAAFQRIFGCFLAGCCAGRPTELPWAVRFPGVDAVVHPTQLYLGATLFAAFVWLRRRTFGHPGNRAWWSVGLYGLINLLIGPLRTVAAWDAGQTLLITRWVYGTLPIVALLAVWRSQRSVFARPKVTLSVGPILVLLALAPSFSRAENLSLRVQPETAVWGEPITLEVAVLSPLSETRQGGITVSFSAPILVLEADDSTSLYYPGDPLFLSGHQKTMPAREVMTEAWYRPWPAGDRKLLGITFVPLSTGVLKIRARAAWILSLREHTVLNLPKTSSCLDQQGYPATCLNLFVERAAPALERLRAALEAAIHDEPSNLRQIHHLIAVAATQGGAHHLPDNGSLPREISAAYGTFLDRLNDPEIRTSPKLSEHLRTLLSDPLDRDALKFFKLLRPAPPDDPIERYQAQCKSYLASLRGGGNLISLIEAEEDVSFGFTTDPQRVILEHQGRRHAFFKGPSIVREMVEARIHMLPESKYQDEEEPVSGTSYRGLLEVLEFVGRDLE